MMPSLPPPKSAGSYGNIELHDCSFLWKHRLRTGGETIRAEASFIGEAVFSFQLYEDSSRHLVLHGGFLSLNLPPPCFEIWPKQ